MMHGQANSR